MALPDQTPSPPQPDIASDVEAFLRLVEPYRTGTPDDLSNVDLKRGHSLRVLDNARRIAATLDLPPFLHRTALLAALYHDVGRFPQYSRYKTFLDRISEDHGALGVKTLLRERLLAALPAAERRLALGAVFLHNRRQLPAGLPDALALIARIVRDADKLDIIQVLREHFTRPVGGNAVVTLHLEEDPAAYSQEIYAQVMAGETARYDLLRYVNDFKLLLCGWTYDLNFPASRAVMRERGHLDGLFAALPPGEAMTRLAEKLRRALDAADAGQAAGNNIPSL